MRQEAERRLRGRVDATSLGMPGTDRRVLLHELQVQQVELELQNEELREAQKQLELSRDRYADLYDFAPVGYVVLDERGWIQDLNLAAAGMLEVERGRLVNGVFARYLAKADRQAFRDCLRQCLAGAGKLAAEVRLAGAKGGARDVRLEGTAVESPEGGTHCRLAIIDLSETVGARREAGALGASRARLAEALEIARLGVWDRDVKTGSTTGDGRFREILGLSEDRPLSEEEVLAMIHPGDRQRVARDLRAALNPEGTGRYESEHRIVRPDGTVRWVAALGEAAFSGEGGRRTVERFAGTVMDITALKEPHDRLTTVLESITDGFFSVDRDLRLTYVNREAERIFRRPRQEVLGRNLWEVFPEAVGSRFQREYERAMAENRAVQFEEFYPPFGQWYSVSAYPSPAGLSVYFQDITERKRTEDALRFLAECDRTVSIEGFFHRLARYLAQSLGMDYVCINRLQGDLLAAQTVAVYYDGRFEDNLSYALQDTPCGTVVKEEACCYPRDVRRLFPNDAVLQEMKAEGYVGTVLRSTQGQPIGLIAVISRHPVANPGLATSILQLVSGRAAAELERRQAEETLRESEERFRFAFDSIPHMAWENSADGATVFRNAWYAVYTGCPLEEVRLPQWDWCSTLHPDDVQRIKEAWKQALAGGTEFRIEVRSRRWDGQYRWHEAHVLPMRDAQGRVLKWYGTNTDIHDRKQAEQALRQIAEQHRLALEAGNLGIWNYDVPSRRLFGDARCRNLFGVTDEAIDYEKFLEIIHPEDRDYVHEAVQKALQPTLDGVYRTEYRVVWPDQSVHWVAASGEAYFEGEGPDRHLAGFIGTAGDITGRKRAEEALRASEADLAAAQRLAGIGSWEWDVATDTARWSEETFRIFAMPPGPMEDHRRAFLDRIHPDDRARVEQALSDAVDGAGDYELEYRIVLPDGTEKVIHALAEVVKDAEGRVAALRGTVHDITGRKRAEEANHRLAAIVESSSDAIISNTLDGTVLTWNAGAESIYGYTAQEMVGRPISVLLPPGHADELPPILERFARGERVEQYETVRMTKSGLEICVAVTIAPVVDDHGRVVGASTIARDITDRRRWERELTEARAAAEAANIAKSQFLANMSHELRTPMNAVLGMTELALRAPLDATVRDCVQTAHDSAQSLLALLNDILDLSRIEAGRLELERSPFCLRATLDQAVKLLAVRACEKGVELIYDVARHAPDRLIGDSLRLRQVLTNLIGNAIKFTHKGEIIVRVDLPPGQAPSADAPDVLLQFSVADTGIGISAEAQALIFAPFQQAESSTTRRYGGTGLGLSITKNIVEMMGGRLWVESCPDRGTTFFFTARFHREPGAACSEDENVLRERLQGVRVLVVDDNATHRRILAGMLAGWGMEPDPADSASAALAKLHEAMSLGAPYGLILIDAMMPEIDGFTLAQWIHEAPALTGAAVLMVSALDRQTVHERTERLKIAAFLEKPVAQDDLLRAVAEAVGVAERRRAPAPAPGPPGAAAKAARSLRVLLAEDTPANQKLVLYILRERGHVVEVAQNGAEAVEKLARQEFDVVLMDVQMPEMDGFQATSAIRGLPDPRKARVPILAMTAHALKGDEQRCLESGMDGYISKPIVADELTAMVERFAGAAAGQPAPPPGGPEPAEPPPGLFDLDEAVSKCMGEYAMFQEIAGTLFDEAGPVLRQMRDALAAGRSAELAASAHRLRGTVVYLGSPLVLDAIQRVEQIGRSDDLTGAGDAIDQLESLVDDLKRALSPHRIGGV